jgi:transposase
VDISPLHQDIRSVEGRAGRDATDPQILLALWLYATLDGVGSARQVARLCEEHVAYQWICGGVSMNYHTLSDFRVAHPEFLDHLLTQSVATLMHEGLVTLDRVAQDGMRVRANAGAASFRRRKTLEECQAEAKEQVEALAKELEEDPASSNRRQDAARRRAARERSEQIRQALAELAQIEAKKKEQEEKAKARASGDEDGRRGLPAGAQRAVRHGHATPGHRGCGRGERGQ